MARKKQSTPGDDAERGAILAELTAVEPGYQIEPEPDCAPIGENEYDEQDLRDLRLSIVLLAGAWDDRGKPERRYFDETGERAARKAISRLLRNEKPLDSAIRQQLAALFDGETHSFNGDPLERKIVFEFRKAGGSKDVTLRDLYLAFDYRTLIESGMAHQRAVAQVCKKYRVSDTAVKEARRRNPALKPRSWAVQKRNNRPG
jgi:hypothetical protein